MVGRGGKEGGVRERKGSEEVLTRLAISTISKRSKDSSSSNEKREVEMENA